AVIGHDPLDDIDICRVVFDEEHVDGRLSFHTLSSSLPISIENRLPYGSPRVGWVSARGGVVATPSLTRSTQRDLPGLASQGFSVGRYCDESFRSDFSDVQVAIFASMGDHQEVGSPALLMMH